MNYISDILFWISTGLLISVIVLLILLFGRALLLIGSFFGQYLSVRKAQATVNAALKDLTPESLDAVAEKLPHNSTAPVICSLLAILEHRDQPAEVQRLISDYELLMEKELNAPKTLAKMGPMLGLMGTLIPMGPALVGLSKGDIASMAYNMQVAFATTVVGLFAAAIGVITQQAKRRWFMYDLTRLEYVADLIHQKSEK